MGKRHENETRYESERRGGCSEIASLPEREPRNAKSHLDSSRSGNENKLRRKSSISRFLVFRCVSRRRGAVLIDRLAEKLKRSCCFSLLLQQSEGIAKHGGEATARQPQHEHLGDGGACAHYRRKPEENGQDIHPEIDSSLPQNALQ